MPFATWPVSASLIAEIQADLAGDKVRAAIIPDGGLELRFGSR